MSDMWEIINYPRRQLNIEREKLIKKKKKVKAQQCLGSGLEKGLSCIIKENDEINGKKIMMYHKGKCSCKLVVER